MFIKYLETENWKAKGKFKEEFKIKNIINRPNGTGKSSMFQAIVFGIFGKMPPGFNLNTLRYDKEAACKVLVKFEHQNDEYVFYRKFGGGQSYVIVKKNEQTVCTSSKEAFAYANDILPYSIISVLWAPNTLTSSSILKPNFLVDHLLEYIFHEPKFLLNHYKKELFAQNKVVKNLENRLKNIENPEDIIKQKEQEISRVQQRLKDRSNFTDSQANRAAAAKTAHEELLKGKWENIIDEDQLRSYLSLLGRNNKDLVKKELEESLEREKQKNDSPLLKVPSASLKIIKTHSEENCKCLVCESEWNQDKTNKIQKVLENPQVKNPSVIQNLESKLKILDLDHELVIKSDRYYRLQNQLKSCQNWKEILDQYDQENNKIWAYLEKLQKEKEELKNQQELKKEYIKELANSKKLSEKCNLINSYIKEASSYYSKTLTKEASDILASLNPRYDQIFLESNEYQISVISSDMSSIDLLSAVQLSSGEKTLVGVSLILAAHKLFFPYSPLLFDESFSALDKENVLELKKLFEKEEYQTFIITHDETWSEELQYK